MNEGIVPVRGVVIGLRGVAVQFQVGLAALHQGLFRLAQIPVIERSVIVDEREFEFFAAIGAYLVVGDQRSRLAGQRTREEPVREALGIFEKTVGRVVFAPVMRNQAVFHQVEQARGAVPGLPQALQRGFVVSTGQAAPESSGVVGVRCATGEENAQKQAGSQFKRVIHSGSTEPAG